MKKILKSSLIITLALFTGCGGGGGGGSGSNNGNNNSSNNSYELITGKVVDGYVKNAKVCVDINNNLKCDNDEPFTYTDEHGNYTLVIENKNYILISTGGIDTQTNTPAITMYSNTTYKNITPLTSVAIKYGEEAVANYFNIDKSKIAANPLENEEIKDIVTNIVNIKLSTGEYLLSNELQQSSPQNISKEDNSSKENNSSEHTPQNTTQKEENVTIKDANETFPPQIIGNLTPPIIN